MADWEVDGFDGTWLLHLYRASMSFFHAGLMCENNIKWLYNLHILIVEKTQNCCAVYFLWGGEAYLFTCNKHW